MRRLAVAMSVACLLGMGWMPRESQVIVDDLDAQIRYVLPIGTHVEQVVAFLDRLEVPHTPYLQPENLVLVTLRGAMRGEAIGNFELQFWFSHDDRLIHYTIRELAER